MENGLAIPQQPNGKDDDQDEAHSHKESTDHANATRNRRPSNNNRTLSNSILAKLSFLRTSTEDSRPTPEDLQSAVSDELSPEHPSGHDGASTGYFQKSAKPRRRTGSLRKTAILGPGRIRAEGRERRNSLRRTSDTPAPMTDGVDDHTIVNQGSDHILPSAAVLTLQRRVSNDASASSSPATSAEWSSPTPPLSLDTSPRQETSSTDAPLAGLSSPVKSPTDASNASTTDDDDGLSFSRPAGLGPTASVSHKPSASSSGSSSCFLSPDVPVRRRSTAAKTPLSPLSALPMDYGAPLEHSYSETEWWGWVVLVVTWLVFVVGMGSCLGVWSWAWDVGQTPYAPPELEDDPTLPIVGYYPALIILTAVMAWVWVVSAWVGMKYFKHAKIPGDD
ncbi:hypothetical protein K461DRAFT_278128 [Myriangium duriaei CBS 260.36]|uniref:Uncharacterized protein n=1 Tax=Myriangium duriaei CBS 260.36 TaxID=1168546 RepID=A0A9P4J6K9_9PEZI|nr:hypothetical protein K461DRAFT_278128 [Myriangium duriaei CBS 260.36]